MLRVGNNFQLNYDERRKYVKLYNYGISIRLQIDMAVDITLLSEENVGKL